MSALDEGFPRTDAEVETAYNNQVPVISQAEAEAGTSTSVRRITPQRIAQAIAALAAGGGGSITVQDEGSTLTTALASMNFVGSGVSVTEGAEGVLTITIAGGSGLALGETSSTAHRGDRGAAAYVHISDDGKDHSDVVLNNAHRGSTHAPSNATADQTDSEIETAYNAQVSVVSQAEAEAGTSTTVRRWTAQRIAQAIAALNTFTSVLLTKLNGIDDGAEVNQTDSEIKTQYENNSNTNAFTDAEKSKVAGLESSKFLGEYASRTALETAYPSPAVGSYANVDTGVGQDVVRYVWDDDDNIYVLQLGESTALTDAQIKTQYENNPDTNAFIDSEKSDLSSNSDHRGLNSGNPHSVTQTEIGLGNVDNTSDGNKPVSTAQQTEIDTKPDLGETSSDAYRGDRGVVAYEHSSSDGSDHDFLDQDVSIGSSPVLDGTNITGVAISAGQGLTLYLGDNIVSGDNYDLTSIPAGGAEVTAQATARNSDGPVFIERYVTEGLGLLHSSLNAGTWVFNNFCSVSANGGDSRVTVRLNKRVEKTGTLTSTGTGLQRTFTASEAATFVSGDADSSILLATLIETPTETFWIDGYTSGTVVTATTDNSGYTNESGVAFAMYYLLFSVQTDQINGSSPTLYPKPAVQSAVPLDPTDEILLAYFFETTSGSNKTVSLYKNGSDHFTNLETPLVIPHDSLSGLNVGDFVHLTAAEKTVFDTVEEDADVTDATNVAAAGAMMSATPQFGGDLDLNGFGHKLVGQTVGGSDGDWVRLSGANTWSQADASAEATAVGQLGRRISATEVKISGLMAATGLTASATYCLSETAGGMVTFASRPTTTGTIVRILGHAQTTTLLRINPDETFVEN